MDNDPLLVEMDETRLARQERVARGEELPRTLNVAGWQSGTTEFVRNTVEAEAVARFRHRRRGGTYVGAAA